MIKGGGGGGGAVDACVSNRHIEYRAIFIMKSKKKQPK